MKCDNRICTHISWKMVPVEVGRGCSLTSPCLPAAPPPHWNLAISNLACHSHRASGSRIGGRITLFTRHIDLHFLIPGQFHCFCRTGKQFPKSHLALYLVSMTLQYKFSSRPCWWGGTVSLTVGSQPKPVSGPSPASSCLALSSHRFHRTPREGPGTKGINQEWGKDSRANIASLPIHSKTFAHNYRGLRTGMVICLECVGR